jgi:hypothetical protein
MLVSLTHLTAQQFNSQEITEARNNYLKWQAIYEENVASDDDGLSTPDGDVYNTTGSGKHTRTLSGKK